MNTRVETNPALPQIGLEILKRLYTGQITSGNFERLCAEWMGEFVNEYRKHLEPTPPQEIVEYRDRKRRDFDYSLSNDFWKSPLIASYLIQVGHVKAVNTSNYHALMFMKLHTPTENPIHSKIDSLLTDFGVRTHKEIYA